MITELLIVFVFFPGLIFSHNCLSALELEVTAKPGENITLYCDCKASTGVFVTWFFRNCSHENQPVYVVTLVDQLKREPKFPRLKFIKNDSSESHDLLVMNATNSDVGVYYCGTEEVKVKMDNDKKIFRNDIYKYGNTTTRLILNTCGPHSDFNKTVEDCSACWKLFFLMCPAVFLFAVLFSSLMFHLLCHKTGKENQDDGNEPEQKRHMEESQDENICYAALEINHPSKRTKKRMIRSSDCRTHTTVKYASNKDSHSPCRSGPT
ncbi:hypothetical protein AMECASPLE_028846 [Ameca splendens]|uniref:Ig-like domain-containing protein n=1 Tax=Ameca splendens TaxID=208324 RepID=A0ABV0ZEE3_9TELE